MVRLLPVPTRVLQLVTVIRHSMADTDVMVEPDNNVLERTNVSQVNHQPVNIDITGPPHKLVRTVVPLKPLTFVPTARSVVAPVTTLVLVTGVFVVRPVTPVKAEIV